MHPLDAAARDCRYAIGIDLGTTNTAVAYVDLDARTRREKRRPIQSFEIPQLVAPGAFGHRPVLPSYCYLPGTHELPEGSTALPWDARRPYAVGEMAREQGARVPGRLVASAKSWLCHGGVDRTAPILPWGAAQEVPAISPVEASTRYLQHLREAWNHRVAQGRGDRRFENQLLILTVPASFDEVARELTVAAARRAGLPHIVLLEEPLAAFYAWLSDHDAARDRMQDGQLVLVCDVGGGTTDFSLIGIRTGEDGPRFDRLAVGDHLMLGGDNMDYTLGRKVEADIAGGPGKLDVRRWHQLVHQCRRAKERLLVDEQAEAAEVTVLGTGASLIGGTLTGTLTRHDVHRLLLDGFFPKAALEEPLAESQRTGLTELGLPYEQDPAITRHLAGFWRRSLPYVRQETGRVDLFPDYLLFNGGVFTPALLRDRLRQTVQRWFQPVAGADWAPVELTNPRLDLAVAMGAAYYGLVRLGQGVRVGSGSPRAYYVGVDAAEPAAEDVHTAVCLVPRGAEEGFVTRLDDVTFEALANHPVTFHLFSSTSRSGDGLGDVVTLTDDDGTALPPIRTAFQFGKKAVARKVPVQLGVRLTEVGTLELWCQSVHTEHRWQLQFDVREEPPSEDEAAPRLEETIDPAAIEAAQDLLRDTFTGDADPDPLWQQLEEILGLPRSEWPMPLLRKLADTVLPLSRDASPQHEAQWLDLLGYGWRPGYGDPVDQWRAQQAWKLNLEGLHHPAKVHNRLAWWTFWRRVGGGLPVEKQTQFYHEARPYVQLEVRTKKEHSVYGRRLSLREKQAAWRTLATLERLPVDVKETLGQLLLRQIKRNKPRHEEMWALARLGTRHPVYGPVNRLVSPDEVAQWLKTLISLPPPRRDYVAYTLIHLARPTGHRDRDVPEAWQQQVHRWLRKMPEDEQDRYRALLENSLRAPVHEGYDWLLGEPLPAYGGVARQPIGIAYTLTEDDV